LVDYKIVCRLSSSVMKLKYLVRVQPWIQPLLCKNWLWIFKKNSWNTIFYMHHWILYVIKLVVGGHSPLRCKRMW
jgi:hypothetical protein